MLSSRRLVVVLATAVLAIAIAVVAFVPLGSPGRPDTGGIVGGAAPSLEIDGRPSPTLDGRVIDLQVLRGQVVWLNFWTTTCVPCRTEMPAMQRLADRYQDEGLTVVGRVPVNVATRTVFRGV